MHDNGHLADSVQTGLGIYYLLVVLLNVGFAAYYFYARKNLMQTAIWGIVAAIFLIHAGLYLVKQGPTLSPAFREFTTELMGGYGGQAGPILYFVGSLALFVAFIKFRKFFTDPPVAWAFLNLLLLAS